MRGEATNDVLCRKRWQMVREDVEDDEFEVDLSGQPHPALLAAVKVSSLSLSLSLSLSCTHYSNWPICSYW